MLAVDAEWSEDFGTVCFQIKDSKNNKSVIIFSEQVKSFSLFERIKKYCLCHSINTMYVNFNSNLNVINTLFLPTYHPDVKKVDAIHRQKTFGLVSVFNLFSKNKNKRAFLILYPKIQTSKEVLHSLTNTNIK